MLKLLKKAFLDANSRFINSLDLIICAINDLEEEFSLMSDEHIRNNTLKFRERYSNGESLDKILPEAFANVREASKRSMGMRHFDVQLKGGIVLHRGMIAEMKTGEGKTLVSTLAAYLNSLTGRGVHIVTTNSYLAKRDAEWMSRIYNMLGVSVGYVIEGINDVERRIAYARDITYGTNNEFGFDYLRDNMKMHADEIAQRDHHYCIIDEVDSVLIDEARTPLIISGEAAQATELYLGINSIVSQLSSDLYEIEEKDRRVKLNEEGNIEIEKLLAQHSIISHDEHLYSSKHGKIVHCLQQCLSAHAVFRKDKDYIVKDGYVHIVDEFTGRVLEGRRYSDGLHQAIEAKEHVEIQQESKTLSSITFQNYFRMYKKLSGMTGTAHTEATELWDIYKLEVIQVPTNVPIARIDEDDQVFGTEAEKLEAMLAMIKSCHAKQQPILIGTASIEKSEMVSAALEQHNIPHQVLNARHHAREAQIIAQAGAPGAITIATNMAGRGTDIQLGGNFDYLIKDKDPEKDTVEIESIRQEANKQKQLVTEAGGLCVIGTERHESRRIDDQLRGRSGRQGDPGKSRFFLSLDDNLLRVFGSDKMKNLIRTLGMKNGESVNHPWLNRAIQKAQMKIEGHNYEIRKQLLKYDDIVNKQRQFLFKKRNEIIRSSNLEFVLEQFIEDVIDSFIKVAIPNPAFPDDWNSDLIQSECDDIFGECNINAKSCIEQRNITPKILEKDIRERATYRIKQHIESFSEKDRISLQQYAFLHSLDEAWQEHLNKIEIFRNSAWLKSISQKDPFVSFKTDIYEEFKSLMIRFTRRSIQNVLNIEIVSEPKMHSFTSNNFADSIEISNDASDENMFENVRRNQNCPCGSGKKFKHCHGKII